MGKFLYNTCIECRCCTILFTWVQPREYGGYFCSTARCRTDLTMKNLHKKWNDNEEQTTLMFMSMYYLTFKMICVIAIWILYRHQQPTYHHHHHHHCSMVIYKEFSNRHGIVEFFLHPPSNYNFFEDAKTVLFIRNEKQLLLTVMLSNIQLEMWISFLFFLSFSSIIQSIVDALLFCLYLIAFVLYIVQCTFSRFKICHTRYLEMGRKMKQE